MNKALKEKIVLSIKERCNELLGELQNDSFDANSFMGGYLYGIIDSISSAKEGKNGPDFKSIPCDRPL